MFRLLYCFLQQYLVLHFLNIQNVMLRKIAKTTRMIVSVNVMENVLLSILVEAVQVLQLHILL